MYISLFKSLPFFFLLDQQPHQLVLTALYRLLSLFGRSAVCCHRFAAYFILNLATFLFHLA